MVMHALAGAAHAIETVQQVPSAVTLLVEQHPEYVSRPEMKTRQMVANASPGKVTGGIGGGGE